MDKAINYAHGKLTASDAMAKRIDQAMRVVAVIHPLTATPQVIQIYSTKNAAGVSMLTWISFMLIGCVFLSYAIVHKLKPYVVTQVLWFIIDLLIVIGILLYGKA